jgi:hypothetical protein
VTELKPYLFAYVVTRLDMAVGPQCREYPLSRSRKRAVVNLEI